MCNWSHQLFTSFNVPLPVASSANQTCLVPVGCDSCISGIMPTACILIARGSPCVVPSSDQDLSTDIEIRCSPIGILKYDRHNRTKYTDVVQYCFSVEDVERILSIHKQK